MSYLKATGGRPRFAYPPSGFFEASDGYGELTDPITIPPHAHAEINFNSPERIRGRPGHGFRIDIPNTQFTVVLWTDPIAMAVGVWKYHIAKRATPAVPISFLDLLNSGWDIAYYQDEDQQWHPDATSAGIPPEAGVVTLMGGENEAVALYHLQTRRVYHASCPFPRPPMSGPLMMGHGAVRAEPQPFNP
ncbi:hypothetical protein MIND_01066500 [Mycena indigotica]|uniref:Uncharacterized protein n=1 Tax=Mycena indigotica TaxID=2126181 RepID=A0A8H6VVB1_9AGAR|nr:uncharacterized protein MIND_01066500 [Mycena indigotica]KAF7295274.1 hypothetical protein MIND_01066500 [Mycena indigotica]